MPPGSPRQAHTGAVWVMGYWLNQLFGKVLTTMCLPLKRKRKRGDFSRSADGCFRFDHALGGVNAFLGFGGLGLARCPYLCPLRGCRCLPRCGCGLLRGLSHCLLRGGDRLLHCGRGLCGSLCRLGCRRGIRSCGRGRGSRLGRLINCGRGLLRGLSLCLLRGGGSLLHCGRSLCGSLCRLRSRRGSGWRGRGSRLGRLINCGRGLLRGLSPCLLRGCGGSLLHCGRGLCSSLCRLGSRRGIRSGWRGRGSRLGRLINCGRGLLRGLSPCLLLGGRRLLHCGRGLCGTLCRLGCLAAGAGRKQQNAQA